MMLHTIQNEELTVTVSEQGAELQSIRGRDGTEYLWQGDGAYWKDRAPTIFPYVARMTQGSYYLDGQLYHMRIHGMAKYSRFRRVENRETELTLELTDDADTYAQYPRHFCFQVIYTLAGSRLDVTYRVDNRDLRTMYFGLGGHPGFRVPLAAGKTFSDYCLRFSEPCSPVRVGFTPACFLNGQDTPYPLEDGCRISLNHALFDEDAIVLRGMSRQVTLETAGDSHSVTVTCPDMTYLGFWHMPHTDAPYVCIEPWSSLPSRQDQVTVFEEQADLISLAPGKRYENIWSITIGQ